MNGSILRRSALNISTKRLLEAAIPATCVNSVFDGQRGYAMTVGSMVPDFDPSDVPHPSTRAPQGTTPIVVCSQLG